ncbi:Hachiman antiphage defense system protein HamA [uncultured Oscillibacter sp.]|uniref:Hachiman antiphage defense system protein HamA n=1 Tax=uncultured Oscillibacter sp. TaxID=876091 RepID=UPI0025DFEF42|nr:Hachiman antiphage defense system protein HamA [uncultured Oscillibacter sp.]
MDRPQYIKWIVSEDGVAFEDQQPLNCYRLSYVMDDAILDDWALHIRRHYVPDDELAEDAVLDKLTVEECLRQYVIPQKGEPFGPTARSNDISEILFADLFEFVLNYEVPRCKQYNRSGKNESEHGTDIIAYRFFDEGKIPHKKDELVAIEVKARLSSIEACETIKDAVADSKKDEHRFSHTLNYYRKKLRSMGKVSDAADVARFQQKTEHPYKTSYVGAAISSLPTIEKKIIVGIKGTDLELKTDQSVFYVHGADLMSLTHQVFERCTK